MSPLIRVLVYLVWRIVRLGIYSLSISQGVCLRAKDAILAHCVLANNAGDI